MPVEIPVVNSEALSKENLDLMRTLLYFVYGYLTTPLSLNTNFYLFLFSITFLILYQLYFRDVIAPTYTFGSIKDMVMSDKFTENPELHKLTIVLSEYFRKKD